MKRSALLLAGALLMTSEVSALPGFSECEAGLLQKAAEGAGLVLSFNPATVDKDTSRKAMDLYGAVLMEELLKCPEFRRRAEEARDQHLEQKRGR